MTSTTAETRVSQLTEALDRVMVGGNHLASVLIHRLGGGFSKWLPPTLDHDTARGLLAGQAETYELWICWSEIMRARDEYSL